MWILWTSVKRESVRVIGDFSVFGCRTLKLRRAHFKKQTEESCSGSCHGMPCVPCSVSTPKDFPELLDGAQTASAPRVLPSSQQPMIQRLLMSGALNLVQMPEVCVLRLVGGREAHSKGESVFFSQKRKMWSAPKQPPIPTKGRAPLLSYPYSLAPHHHHHTHQGTLTARPRLPPAYASAKHLLVPLRHPHFTWSLGGP